MGLRMIWTTGGVELIAIKDTAPDFCFETEQVTFPWDERTIDGVLAGTHRWYLTHNSFPSGFVNSDTMEWLLEQLRDKCPENEMDLTSNG